MTFSTSSEQSDQKTQATARGVPRRLIRDRVLWLAFALGIAACLAIYFHLPYVNGPRGPKQWVWPYMHRSILLESLLGAVWRLALGALVIGGAAWLVGCRLKQEKARQRLGLLALFLWGVFFVWTSLAAATPWGLARVARIVKSPTWTSYLTLAQWIRDGRQPPLAVTLERYAELIPEFPLHARTHPPGLVLASYGLLSLFDSNPRLSATLAKLYAEIGADPESVGVEQLTTIDVTAVTLACLTVIIGLLGVFPIFWVAQGAMKQTAGAADEAARRTAWTAAALWVHYPALVLMLPAFDLVYPPLALLCIILAMKGLNERPVAWGVTLGLAFMTGIFLTFPLLLLAPLLCIVAVLELSRRAGSFRPVSILGQASLRSPGGRRLWILTGATVVTCVAVETVLRYMFHIHLMQIFFAAVHHQNTVELAKLNRTFRVWVFYNIWDFLLFAGLPLAVLALVWFARAFREAWRDPAGLMPALAAFPLMVLIVDLSHQLSAETARVWLFLAPGIVWAGAAEMVHRAGDRWRRVLVGLLLAQALFIYVCRTNMMLWGF
ncbi:MAG: hypothetical protein HXY20_05520 [Acidobacteria bacterium]|nr:hypothetical protein [Acidobacteriota bacterium]